jgi:hypothetical protein
LSLNCLSVSFSRSGVDATASLEQIVFACFESSISAPSMSSVRVCFPSSRVSGVFAFQNSTQAGISLLQTRLLAHVYCCATRFARRPIASALERGDSSFLSRVSFEQLLANSGYDLCKPGYLAGSSSCVPIIASRVALPESLQPVSLLELLPANIARVYADPQLLLLPADKLPNRMPRARLHSSRAEYLLLVRRMASLGMVRFTAHPRVVNGVFGTPKGDNQIRLIIDARPANAHFVKPQTVQLPTPDLLARLYADADRDLFVAKIDLDNFYHRLELPSWMQPFFALPSVAADDVGMESQFGSGTRIYPCCATLPMGWSHSVFVAQAAHEHFLDTSTKLQLCDRINWSNDLRIDRLRHQVYIDDVNLIGNDCAEVLRMQEAYIAAVQKRGFPVKPSKVIRPTARGAEVLGIDVDGTSHTVGLSAEGLCDLVRDTLVVLRAGCCSGHTMSHVVGRWTWAFLVRRCALSVFSSVYRFIECADHRVFDLWPSVRNELLVACGLVPLLHVCLSSRWFPHVIATDASEGGLGVVATSVEEASSRDMAAANCGVESVEDDSGVDGEEEDSELVQLVRTRRWRTIVSAPWMRSEHINVLELRAVDTALRWVASSPLSISRRVLVLSDSQVAIGALNKGRSSAPLLLRRLRAIAALLLAAGLQLYVNWLPSASNPADEPSRRH